MVNHCLQTWSTDALLEDVGTFPWASLLVTHGLGTGNPLYDAYYRTVPRFIRRPVGRCGYVPLGFASGDARLRHRESSLRCLLPDCSPLYPTLCGMGYRVGSERRGGPGETARSVHSDRDSQWSCSRGMECCSS